MENTFEEFLEQCNFTNFVYDLDNFKRAFTRTRRKVETARKGGDARGKGSQEEKSWGDQQKKPEILNSNEISS